MGNDHIYALKLDNTVECWGNNNKGQTDIPTDLVFKQIVAGPYVICALKINNDVQCWGDYSIFGNNILNPLNNLQVKRL